MVYYKCLRRRCVCAKICYTYYNYNYFIYFTDLCLLCLLCDDT